MKTLHIPFLLVVVLIASQAFNATAQTETELHSFPSATKDGQVPLAGLVQGSDGNFYGTSSSGGTHDYGTVFKISTNGDYSTLYSFGATTKDGLVPVAGLVQGTDGNFYGTTSEGGKTGGGGVGGLGTVFRISPSGSYTNFYSFGNAGDDGYTPYAGLVQGSDSNFYGTTTGGGTGSGAPGTVFQMSPSGTYSTLHSFGIGNDGFYPLAGLVLGSDGNFYGTTEQGGTHGFGVIFRISSGGTYSNLYSLGKSADDGQNPYGGLVEGTDGNFYGTTDSGGVNGIGAVFRISPAGIYANLYSFDNSADNGNGAYEPQAGLVQGSDGNFYGTTYGGGTNVVGAAFRISPAGGYKILYSFGNSTNDGENPVAALVQGNDGSFYGTTSTGGTNDGSGTVFKLTVPLNPPADDISFIKVAGTNVLVTILSVAGETYQLQDRTSLSSGSWSNVLGAAVTNCIGSRLTLTNLGGASKPQKFYRYAITP